MDPRNAEIQRLVRAYLRDSSRQETGESDIGAIVRGHPNLEPDLGIALRRAAKVRAASRASDIPVQPHDTPELSGFERDQDSTLGPRVRCPICLEFLRVGLESRRQNIICPTCGGSFGVVDANVGDSLPRRLGDFELLEQIGAGGFGVVWKARDTQLDRLVAIKVPRRGALGSQELEAFVAEARFVAQLRHPGIVRVYQVGRENDRVYIVSDLIDGAPLTKTIEGGGVSSQEAVDFCLQVCGALQHAHRAGIIHRDLKPANILVDHDGRAHLTDFGLALGPRQEVTINSEGQVVGTPAYMSPEQAQGRHQTLDPRSDIYSLGVILFELLTGERPFRGDVRAVLKQVVQDDPPRPRELRRSIPRDLENIVLMCLRKEPERRYNSAGELASDLRRWLDGETIVARPLGSLERARRWCERNPLVAAWFAAAGLVLLLTTLGIFSIARRKQVDLAEAIADLQSRQADRRVELVRIESLVDELARTGEPYPSATPEVWQSRLEQAYRRQLTTEPPGPTTLQSLSFYDPAGRMLATFPLDPTLLGGDFSDRDYFQGAVRETPGRNHVSTAYRSRRDQLYKIAVSRALRDAPENPPLAVLSASVVTADSRSIAREERLVRLLTFWAALSLLPLFGFALALLWRELHLRRKRIRERKSLRA